MAEPESATGGEPTTLEMLTEALSRDERGREVFDMDAVVSPHRVWKIDERSYVLPADVPTPMLLQMVAFEEAPEEQTSEQAIARMSELADQIRVFLAAPCYICGEVHNLVVPDPFPIGQRRIGMAISYLLGGNSAVETAMRALSGGPLAAFETALADVRRVAEERGEIEPEPDVEEGGAPLASGEPSSQQSPASRRSTTGRRAGGRKRRGGSSAST